MHYYHLLTRARSVMNRTTSHRIVSHIDNRTNVFFNTIDRNRVPPQPQQSFHPGPGSLFSLK